MFERCLPICLIKIVQKVKHLTSGVWCAYAQLVPQGATMGAVESARELGDGFRYIQLYHEAGGGSFRYIQLYHGGGGGRFSDIYTTLPWWRGCPGEGGVAADTDHCV